MNGRPRHLLNSEVSALARVPFLDPRTSGEEGGEWGRVSKLICSSIAEGAGGLCTLSSHFPGSPEGELASGRLLPVVKSALPRSSFVYFVFN